MLASTYLRDAHRMVKSPLTMGITPDGTYAITHKICGIIWECSDAEGALAIYKQLRRNYLAMFPRD